MVRKATRLPPNTRSLEEVVLSRVVSADASSAARSSVTAPAPVPASASSAKRLASARRVSTTARQARSCHYACACCASVVTSTLAFDTDVCPRAPPSHRAFAAAQAPSASVSRRNASITIPQSLQRASALASSYDSPTAMLGASASVECMTQIAGEMAALDKRVRSLAPSESSDRRSSMHREARDQSNAASSHHQQEIDKFLQQSMDEIYKASKARRGRSGSAGAVDPTTGAHVTHAVRDIRSTVRRLDRVFYEVASGDKQRQIAATKIAMAVRAFITRRRFVKFHRALGTWRTRKCAQLLLYVEQFSAREEFINRQIGLLHEERTAALLRRVLAELRDVVLMNLPLRMRRLEETERRFQLKQRTLLKCVVLAWKAMALGPRSRKRVIADAKKRHMEARQRLEALGRFELVTTEMVHDEFLKENIRTIRSRHERHVLRMYFRLVVETELLPMQRSLARAVAHDRKKTLVRIWSAWLPLFRAAQVDKALARVSERRTLDRFDKHHNLRRIDAHYRRSNLLKHLRAWAQYGQRIRRVRKLFEDNTKENLGRLLRKWHVRAQYQHALRANTVEEWRAYCRRIFQTPFRCWYVHAAQKKSARVAKETICVAYERRQRRHTKYNFFRLWKHQVLFGTVEGIHSKLHLLQSLEDQKRMCLGLEANAKLYQDNISALHASIAQLEHKLSEKQLELAALHDATQVTRFGIHTAEQNIARVQGMLEAVRHIHPGTVERIEKLYSDTPLLSQDLKDVLSLHVRKRQELLSKIELDETELEVHHAARGVSEDDQLLLHRVKWVLSRLDLQQMRVDGADASAAALASVPRDAMHQLCALFEFIRDGDTAALTAENSPDTGLRASTSSGHAGDSAAPTACLRQDVFARTETWHAFVQELTLKFIPERMLSVRERLVKRAAALDCDVAAIKANPHIYNLYSGAAQVSGTRPRKPEP